MSLSNCPACRQLCFLNSASCQSCGQVFEPDALQACAAAEEKFFQRTGITMFLAVLFSLLALLLLMAGRGQMNGLGLFRV